MAAAYVILALELVVLIAMIAVWCFHLWGSEIQKKRLSAFRHRLFDKHWHSY